MQLAYNIKTTIILIMLILGLNSCTNNEINKLEWQIQKLETQLLSCQSEKEQLKAEKEQLKEQKQIINNLKDENWGINLNDLYIKEVVKEFGPIEFIYENENWYIVKVNSKTEILKIPLKIVYSKLDGMSWDEKWDLKSSESQYIESVSPSKRDLRNIVSSSKTFDLESLDLRLGTTRSEIEVILYNTTGKDITKYKIRIQIYKSEGLGKKGDLLAENEVIFHQAVRNKEMKYVIQKFKHANLGSDMLYSYDFNLVDWE